ncbi:MAG: endolytic transglycosylase MltG [Actinomycetota bacterium]|nr:endolytic transglycosylase MltG [Actinomycetota bacterium]
MTETGVLPDSGRRRHGTNRGRGCLAALVALVVIVAAGWFLVSQGVGFVDDRFGDGDDYAGPGSGSVTVVVPEGASGRDIAELLTRKDVVADADTLESVIAADPDGNDVQPGTYTLQERMSSQGALDLLLEGPAAKATVTIPEGYRVEQVAARVAQETDIPSRAMRRAIEDTAALALPAYAEGDAEGYLFPAQYEVDDDTTALSLTRDMVDRFKTEAQRSGLQARARRLGVSAHDAVTIASLVQAEARQPDDFGRVARVVYNRRDDRMPLQFDSTVQYAVGRSDGNVFTGDDERRIDSPYNTYRYAGLPPGAIGNPGLDAIEAALEPTDGDWLYFVTVNLKTGETVFSDSLAEHNRNVARLREYCTTSDLC